MCLGKLRRWLKLCGNLGVKLRIKWTEWSDFISQLGSITEFKLG